MKNRKKKLLQKVFQEFLAEQQSILKPQTYSGSKLSINYFERYLNGYGSRILQRKLFEANNEVIGKYKKSSEMVKNGDFFRYSFSFCFLF